MSNDLKKDIMQGSNSQTSKNTKDTSTNTVDFKPPRQSSYTHQNDSQKNTFRLPQVLHEHGTMFFDKD